MLTSVPLHVGAGYSGDPDWSHGRWMGRQWSTSTVYDLTDPAVAGRIPFGVIDHLAHVRLGDEQGWGLFEHATMGLGRPDRIRRLVFCRALNSNTMIRRSAVSSCHEDAGCLLAGVVR